MTATPALTPGQLALLRTELQARRRELAQALALHQGSTSRVAHAREVLLQDADDAPQRDAEREVDQAITEHDIAELAAMDDALARMDKPGYGRCIACGDDIPFDRLKAAPQALRCVACEGALESAEGRGRAARL